VRRLFAALVLLFALAPAGAAEGWERFFELSFGDLRVEAAEAKSAGKQGLMVMYHFDDCPYCARMKSDVLSRPEVQGWYRARYRAIAIDTRGSQEVTGFDGRTLRENEYARAIGVRATPSFAFYATDGTLLYTHRGGVAEPAEFILIGEYVSTGAFRAGSFAAYKQSKLKRGS
jgi:thioredoxin-related protein